MAYKQTEAIKRAKARVGNAYPAGWCQKWVVTEVFASGGVGDYDGDRAADAEDGWKAAKKKVAVTSANASSIPAGYPIYFTGGRNDHGHAAVSAGNGQMYTTDLNAGKTRYGRIGLTPIRTAEIAWGVKLVGYVITDGNGNTFTDPKPTAPKPKPAKPIVPWFNASFSNTHWNSIVGGKVAAVSSTASRLAQDSAAGNPAIATFCEVRQSHLRTLDAEMSERGYKRVAYTADNMIAAYVRPSVDFLGQSFARFTKQDGGNKEGVLRLKFKVDGSRAQIGVLHLDHDSPESYKRHNLKQAYNALRRYGIATLLPDWKSRTLIIGDFNDPDVASKVLKPLGFKQIATDSGIDQAWVGAKRAVRGGSSSKTASDHKRIVVRLGKSA